MNEKALLTLLDVTKIYEKERESFCAVDGVSFSIAPGETVALVGESGCGKSTLARMIAGMTPPTHGEIRFEGQVIASEEVVLSQKGWRQLRRKMQMILQDPRAAVSPRMRVEDFMLEPYRCFSLCGKEEAEKRIQNLISRVGLDKMLLKQYPHELSGGELQRIVIARALAVSPSLLLCDEPTSALDPLVQMEVVSLLTELQKEEKMAMLFISHDLALASQIAGRILVMSDGRIVEELSSEHLDQAQHPYTRMLLRAAEGKL